MGADLARAVAAFGASAFGAAAFGGGVAVFGGGALATHTSPSACLPCGHTNGQTRLWIPCTALIASDDTSSGLLMEVSLMNLCQADLVASSNSPLTSPLKQPTRWSSTCNERVSVTPQLFILKRCDRYVKDRENQIVAAELCFARQKCLEFVGTMLAP